MIQKFDS